MILFDGTNVYRDFCCACEDCTYDRQNTPLGYLVITDHKTNNYREGDYFLPKNKDQADHGLSELDRYMKSINNPDWKIVSIVRKN